MQTCQRGNVSQVWLLLLLCLESAGGSKLALVAVQVLATKGSGLGVGHSLIKASGYCAFVHAFFASGLHVRNYPPCM